MLPARTAGTVRVYADVLVPDLNVDVFLNIRHDITGHKRCLALTRRIKRGNTHQAVHAFFGFEVTICIGAVYLKCNRFDAGFFSFVIVQHFQLKAPGGCPPCIHPVQHRSPVAGFRAACAGMKRNDRIVFIVFAGEQCFAADFLISLRKPVQQLPDLRNQRRVVFLITHLD